MGDAEELRLLRQGVHEVAHELANILGVALNYAHFLTEDLAEADVADRTRQHVRYIESAARRGADLLTSLRQTTADLAEQQVGPDGAEQ
jgi:signal transduction histidine kinase